MRTITQAVITEGLCKSWPTLPSSTPLQYVGLHLAKGYSCPTCSSLHISFHALQNHSRQTHQVSLFVNGRYQKTDIQRLSENPAAKSWFAVHLVPPPSPTPYTSYLDNLRTQLNIPASISSTQIDLCQVNVWQATTRWNQWVATQDTNVLLELIEYPKPDSNLANLAASVHYLLDKVYKFIPIAGELCCQILNTKENIRCCS